MHELNVKPGDPKTVEFVEANGLDATKISSTSPVYITDEGELSFSEFVYTDDGSRKRLCDHGDSFCKVTREAPLRVQPEAFGISRSEVK